MDDAQRELRRLQKIRPSTVTGGYEEIPKELILEQARKMGIPERDIPEIRIRDVSGGAYIEKTPEGKVVIVIPRREPKWKVPDTLRHELAHCKLGRISSGGTTTWEKWIKGELEVERLQWGGKLKPDSLSSVVITLTEEDGLPRNKAIAWVTEEARKLGATERSIATSEGQLKDYWSRLDEARKGTGSTKSLADEVSSAKEHHSSSKDETIVRKHTRSKPSGGETSVRRHLRRLRRR